MSNRYTAYKLVVTITFIAMIAINALANIIPIGGVQTGQVSDSYPNLFAPAGFTFGIWAVIYFLLGTYILYQFRLFRRQLTNERIFKEIAPYFILSSLANILWIFAWHNFKITATVFFMLLILLSLIKVQQILKGFKLYQRDKLFISAPFSIYFGWITVATIANITTYLVSINWGGFGLGEVTWTVIALIMGLVIGFLTIYINKDIAYGGVIIWAYIGILVKHISPYGFDGEYKSVIFVIILSIILLLIAMALVHKKIMLILVALIIASMILIKVIRGPNVTVEDKTINLGTSYYECYNDQSLERDKIVTACNFN